MLTTRSAGVLAEVDPQRLVLFAGDRERGVVVDVPPDAADGHLPGSHGRIPPGRDVPQARTSVPSARAVQPDTRRRPDSMRRFMPESMPDGRSRGARSPRLRQVSGSCADASARAILLEPLERLSQHARVLPLDPVAEPLDRRPDLAQPQLGGDHRGPHGVSDRTVSDRPAQGFDGEEAALHDERLEAIRDRTAAGAHLLHRRDVSQPESLNAVASLVDAGKVRTTSAEVFAPIDAANLRKAHARGETGRTIGMVVLANWS